MTSFQQYITEQEQPFQIWQDMDGCLTAFEDHFRSFNQEKLSPDEYEQKYGDKSIWPIIDKGGIEYWAEMPWMPDGKELWNFIKPFNPIILSAPSKNDSSRPGKQKWCQQNIELPNYNVQTKAKHGWDGESRIVLNSDKWRYCRGSTDILIDDTIKKIDGWVKAGGIGILHKSAAQTIAQLKSIIL